jgi:predicted AAA+ superfamily ATPase
MLIMYRFLIEDLKEWAARQGRKPLVLRGARQVGKSFLVRMLAEADFENLAEINFEQMPDAAELFASKQPNQIVSLLELRLNQSITPGKTLLFLDEIQAAPEVFASLRYFYEQMPQLHVIAAGSLLEFVLEEHTFSMPVGRIEYMHLGPMTFEEILLAMDMKKMVEFISRYKLPEPVPDSIHHELMRLVKDFCVIGGMPEAIKTFARTRSYLDIERVTGSILSTYRDDFAKYGRRFNARRIEKVFSKIPMLIGQKFMYSQIDREEKSRDIKQAMHALEDTKIIYRVLHSDANGIPLGAETNERHFKTVFLDVGLVCRACGLSMRDIQDADNIVLINSGAICEQLVAQHLLYSGQPFDLPSLFCWMRQRGGSNAEVDYLINQGTTIIPVEVKAGKSGSLKSLHYFLSEKHRDFALRFNADTPSIVAATTSISGMQPQPFRLLSLPFYLLGQTNRLCRENYKLV